MLCLQGARRLVPTGASARGAGKEYLRYGGYMKNILMSEADVKVENEIKTYLEKQGYTLVSFSDGESLYKYFKKFEQRIDMVLLGVNMPNDHDLEVLKAIRLISKVPVILISSLDHEVVKVKGLKLGCDDAMIKPISLTELSARMEAIERRVYHSEEMNHHFGGISKRNNSMKEYNFMNTLELSGTEYKMLYYLINNFNSVVPKEELLLNIWGIDSSIKTRVTDDTLKRIRKKLTCSEAEVEIVTVRGVGYVARNRS